MLDCMRQCNDRWLHALRNPPQHGNPRHRCDEKRIGWKERQGGFRGECPSSICKWALNENGHLMPSQSLWAFRKNVRLWLTDKCALRSCRSKANTVQGKNGYNPVNTE